MHPAHLFNSPFSSTDHVPLTAREALSGLFGTISLVSWIFVFVPQVLENHRNKSGDGVSLAFLMIWLLGDVANLAGSIEANLLSTIVTLAIYFCLADCIIISQTMYYMYIYDGKLTARRQSHAKNNPTQPLLSRRRSSAVLSNIQTQSGPLPAAEESVVNNIFLLLGVVLTGCLSWFLAWKSGLWDVTVDDGKKHAISWIGTSLGYLSAVLYLGARVPQILKNYNNKSCDGLSILFFLLSLMGNITYGAGILFHSTEKTYVLANLPWLIGSLGTIGQDFIVRQLFWILGCWEISSSSEINENFPTRERNCANLSRQIFGQFHYYSKKERKETENGSAIV